MIHEQFVTETGDPANGVREGNQVVVYVDADQRSLPSEISRLLAPGFYLLSVTVKPAFGPNPPPYVASDE